MSIELEKLLRDPPSVLRSAQERARRYRGKPARVLVAAIRAYVSETVRYAEDRPVDHWSDPARTARLRSGDCEDQAILGLFMALSAGIPAERAAVAIGRDRRGNQHAVLVVLGQDFRSWTFDIADPGSPPLSRSGFRPVVVGFVDGVGFPVSQSAARSSTELPK